MPWVQGLCRPPCSPGYTCLCGWSWPTRRGCRPTVDCDARSPFASSGGLRIRSRGKPPPPDSHLVDLVVQKDSLPLSSSLCPCLPLFPPPAPPSSSPPHICAYRSIYCLFVYLSQPLLAFSTEKSRRRVRQRLPARAPGSWLAFLPTVAAAGTARPWVPDGPDCR